MQLTKALAFLKWELEIVEKHQRTDGEKYILYRGHRGSVCFRTLADVSDYIRSYLPPKKDVVVTCQDSGDYLPEHIKCVCGTCMFH